MRYNEIIKEIDRIDDITPGDIIDTENNSPDYIINNSKKLPGNMPWRYSVIQGLGGYHIYIIDPNHQEIIGQLEIEEIPFPLKRAGRSNYITVHQSYTRYGIAKSMYGIWLAIMKRPLVSGTKQTPGGRRNWLSLNSIPGVEAKGYIKIWDEIFDSEYIENYTDRIMNTGGQYIGKDKGNNHYFSFDVRSNNDLGELEAVYNQAMTLYNGSDDYVTTGLYAIWTGR